MARRRFFVDHIHHQQAEVNGEDAHHLTRVLRVERGQRYEISDNISVFLAEVAEARKDRVLFSLLEPVPLTPPPVAVTLVAAIIKFDRLEWIFEKCTELGVERFLLFSAERSEKGLEQAAPKRVSRWNRVLSESSQQSRRDRLPLLLPLVTFAAALATAATCRLMLEEEKARPILSSLPAERSAADSVALLLGPEGGWTAREREQASKAGWAAVSLGPSILRAETAAVAGVAVLNAAWAKNCTIPL